MERPIAAQLDERLRTRCPVCAAGPVRRLGGFRNTGRYRFAAFEDLVLLTCDGCGCSWADDPPSAAQLADYYGNAANYSAGRMAVVDADEWPIWDSRAASLLVLARLFAQFRAGDRMVDVGPGNGAALSLANHLLPQAQLACIEYSRKSIEFFSRHIDRIVVLSSMDDASKRWGLGSVKLIYSSHCLEHLPASDLRRELRSFRTALRDDGVMALEVPFAPQTRVMATKMHTPHLVFFTVEGLTALLEDEGFDVRLIYVAVSRSRNSFAWMKRHFPVPGPDVAGGRFSTRIGTLNVGDFVSRNPQELAGRGSSGAIKCIATKSAASSTSRPPHCSTASRRRG